MEYESNHPPFSYGSGILGRIDFVQLELSNSIVVRGWCFHILHRVRALTLYWGGIEKKIVTYGLDRDDVSDTYPSYDSLAHKSGFVCVFPLTAFEREMNPVAIEAKIILDNSDETVVWLLKH